MRSIGFILVAVGLGCGVIDLQHWWLEGDWALMSVWDALDAARGAGVPVSFGRADLGAFFTGGLDVSAFALFSLLGLAVLCLTDDV